MGLRGEAFHLVQDRGGGGLDDFLPVFGIRLGRVGPDAAIREVAADTMPPVRTSDLSMAALADSIRLDEADAENLEDALGGHLGECVMVD